MCGSRISPTTHCARRKRRLSSLGLPPQGEGVRERERERERERDGERDGKRERERFYSSPETPRVMKGEQREGRELERERERDEEVETT